MDLLFKLSIIIFTGIIGGRLAKKLKLPNVSGYIVGGLILGPSFIKLVGSGEASQFNIINEVALAAIAFSIGSEFLWSEIKKTGKNILIITVAEVFGAIALVFIVTYFIFGQPFEFSLVIASMSAATAPAGILMVIRQLKAIGGILGIALSYLAPRAKGRDELLTMVLGFILMGTGAANFFGVSSLLACMMLGAVLINLMKNSNRVFNLVSDFTPPIYLLFFTIAGASLDLAVLSTVGLLGVGYILARAAGKIIGARIGAKYVGADENVVKYLGMSLLTQGGISIGLSMIVASELPQYSESIITVILFSVLVYEIAGPILAKIAIQKSGEDNVGSKKLNKKTKAV